MQMDEGHAQDTPVMRRMNAQVFNRVDFWGPASNFGIPIAAVMDTQKDPEMYVSYLCANATICASCPLYWAGYC
jgi:hypothetical protein